jgi:hypothetical protein
MLKVPGKVSDGTMPLLLGEEADNIPKEYHGIAPLK